MIRPTEEGEFFATLKAGFVMLRISTSNAAYDGGLTLFMPAEFFPHNSKTPGDIKKKLSDFNFTL